MSSLRSAFAAVDRFVYPVAPAERLAMLRLAVGAFAFIYLSVRFRSFTSLGRMSREFLPVGPLSWMTAPLPHAVLVTLSAALLVLALGFCLGIRYRIVGPAFAMLLLFLTTYRSSFGMKFHTENLLFWQVAVLAVAPAADTLSIDARGRARPEAHGRYGWAPRAAAVLMTVIYVLAGVAKIRLGGDGWLSGEILQAQIAYDNLRKIELGSIHAPLGVLLVPHLGALSWLAWLTLAVELGAPLALKGGRFALVWCLFSWGFHFAVLATMAIAFAYPLSGVPYLAFFRAERLLERRPFRSLARLFSRAAPA